MFVKLNKTELGCDKEELSDFVKNWVKHAHYLRTRGFCLSTLFIWSILSATNKNEKHECTYCWKGCLGLLYTIHTVLLIGVYIGKKKRKLVINGDIIYYQSSARFGQVIIFCRICAGSFRPNGVTRCLGHQASELQEGKSPSFLVAFHGGTPSFG